MLRSPDLNCGILPFNVLQGRIIFWPVSIPAGADDDDDDDDD